MSVVLDQLDAWMLGKENERLEFKEAKNNFHFEKLVDYCAALANEGGGTMILGVTDKTPWSVVGSRAFQDLERTKAGLVERLRLRIDAEEISHPKGRVVVFQVPSRPLGMPIGHRGVYWMRAGQDLVPMTPDRLRQIFHEAGPDFSAEICGRASLEDLDPSAVERFRSMWRRKSGNESLDQLPVEQVLTDAELLVAGKLTYAALILFGTRRALGRRLAQAEVILEYRSSEASIPSQRRDEYREGFFLFADDLWKRIADRNEVLHFQDGLFVWDIPAFNEAVIREAVLNAVSHRDYRLAGSVFVRHFPRKLEVVSPGGFPPGITVENILWRQSPRNRRIAEVFAKCGLVERSGQGANRMFEGCIKEGKPKPDFSGTDDHQVAVTFCGEIQDTRFLRFLERLGRERLASFTTQDLLILDAVHGEQLIEDEWVPRLPVLVEQGVLERIGRGTGTRYVLSRQLYGLLGKRGVYTRKRGLDRETNKALLLKHIEDSQEEGSPFAELLQVLPALSREQVKRLLRELKQAGHVQPVGSTRTARWYPAGIGAKLK